MDDKWFPKFDGSYQVVEETSPSKSLNDIWYSKFFDNSSESPDEVRGQPLTLRQTEEQEECICASLSAPEIAADGRQLCPDQSLIEYTDKVITVEENWPKESIDSNTIHANSVTNQMYHGCTEHIPEGNACQEITEDSIDEIRQNDKKRVTTKLSLFKNYVVTHITGILLPFVISLILYFWIDQFDLGSTAWFWINIAKLAYRNRDLILKQNQHMNICKTMYSKNTFMSEFKWIYDMYEHFSFKPTICTFPICIYGADAASAMPMHVIGERNQNSHHYSSNNEPVRQVCQQSDCNEVRSENNRSYLPSNDSNETSGISDGTDFLSSEGPSPELMATASSTSFVPDSSSNEFIGVEDDQHPNCIIISNNQLPKMKEVKKKNENEGKDGPKIHLVLNCTRKQKPVPVKYGSKSNLQGFLHCKEVGGVILENALRRDIKDRMFEQGIQYRISAVYPYHDVGVTKSGVYFIMKTIPRYSFSVDKVDKYIATGGHKDFLQTLYGVVVREASVDLLFSYQEGVTIEEYTLGHTGKRWNVQQTISFIYHLVLAVQMLHRMGITLLGITSKSIQLDTKCTPSSIRFMNVQFSDDRKMLNENEPLYSPPECEQRSTSKSYDMWCVGAVLFFLASNGKQLWGEEWSYTDLSYQDWSLKMRQKIRDEAASVHSKILNVGWGNNPYTPALKHLIACLLNPVWQNRATSYNIHQHPLFYGLLGKNSKSCLERDLLVINPRRHECPHCVVTVTNGQDILYITTVPKGKPLFSLLKTKELQQQVPRLKQYVLHFDKNQHCIIKDDVILVIHFPSA